MGVEHVAPSGGNEQPGFRRRRNATERDKEAGFLQLGGPGAAEP